MESRGNLGYVIVNGSLDFETDKNYTFLVRRTFRERNYNDNINLVCPAGHFTDLRKTLWSVF